MKTVVVKKGKAILVTGLFALLFSGGVQGEGPSSPKRMAPDFSLKNLRRETVRLSDYRGKVVILNFWATWCPPCRKEIPDFIELFNRYSSQGLMILGISVDQDGEKALRPFMEKFKINYPILLADGKVERAYGGIGAIPTTFIIDRKGLIRENYIGFRAKSVFEEDVKELLAIPPNAK